MSKIGKKLFILLAVFALASNSWAVDVLDVPDMSRKQAQVTTVEKASPVAETRIPGRTDVVPEALFGHNGPWVAPRSENRSLDLEAVVWVDDDWTDEASVDAFNSPLTWGLDAFASVQDAIDAVAPGGTVNVLPGAYAEASPGRFLFNATGPYQFGLHIDDSKDGITIQGVADNPVATPITSYAGVLASISLHATNSFGASGIFLEADDVTITGLELYQIINHNKSIEVIGDNLTFKWNKITDGNSLYFNDWRYDTTGSDLSWIQSYHIEGNLFDLGTSVDLASGAGFSGPVSGRQIINNDFEMDWPNFVDNWPAISFNGSGSGVPWFVYSVGAAVIEGNSFSDAEGLYIRHRGDFANFGDFDWEGYWNDNTFDKKVMFGANPPSVQGTYTYTSGSYTFNNVKEIGASIQREIDRATAGDIVLCGDGTYAENVVVNKTLTLLGANADVDPRVNCNVGGVRGAESVIDGSLVGASVAISANDVEINGFTIQGGINGLNAGVYMPASFSGAQVKYNVITGNTIGIYANCNGASSIYRNLISANNLPGPAGGSGIYSEYTNALTIDENEITGHTDNNPAIFAATAVGVHVNLSFTENNVHDTYGVYVLSASGTFSGNQFSAPGVTALAFASGCAGIDVLNNSFSNAARGIRIQDDGYGFGNNSDIEIHGNSFSGLTQYTVGYISGYSGTLDASGNWWGTNDASGVPATLNTTGGAIDYTPWLDTGVEPVANLCDGFQGNLSTLLVDDDSPQAGAVGILQEAVNLVSGSTINLMPGTYVGQIHAANFTNLNIVGSGTANTFIKAPATAMTDFFVTAGPPVNNNYPIVFFDNSTANISNLTIDGDGKGNLQYRFIGLAYWNSSGDVNDVDIVSVRNTPLDGSQHGVGLYVFHDVAGSYDVDVTNVNISDFQKNGTVFAGAGTNVDCNNVDITGAGPMGVPMPAQNGFQFSPSTTGTLVDCSVNGIVYTGPSAVATSILTWGDIDLTNTSVSNGHVGIYGIDADVSVDGGTFTSTNAATAIEKYGLFFYSTGAALATNRPMPQPIDATSEDFARDGDRSLDANEVVTIDDVEVIGDGSAGGYGVSAYVDGDNLEFTMTDSKVAYWNYGVDLTANGGTIAPATVTGSTLINTVNTYDNTSGHTWDSNCYSDFTSNPGFPSTYQVGDNEVGMPITNADANPNPNGCSDVNFVVSDPLIGCDSPCNTTLLYITLDAAGLPNLQLTFTLPTGFSTVGGIVTPGANVDPNLLNAYATVAGQVVTLDMGFQDPGSTGDNTKYVACFTLTNNSAGTGIHTVYGNSSLWIDGLGGNHVNELLLGSIDITVDCTPPAAPTTFVNNGTCAYGPGYMPADVFSVTGLTAGGGAALQTVWVTFNGNVSPTFPITLVGADPYDFTFPAAGSEATFYGYLDDLEGCNTLNLHVTDAECNTAVFDLTNVGWDATDPAPVVSYTQSQCYNNILGDPQYGATLLVGDLEIDLAAAGSCQASLFDLTLSIGAEYVYAYTDVTLISDYPSALEAATLWNAIVTSVGVNYSGAVTVNWSAVDCAGNEATGSFNIPCVDFAIPGNTVTTFDARPADGGVWLNWAWTPDVNQAVEMRIYRSPISGGYPAYDPPLRDSYDSSAAALAGWTLVETQIIGSGQTSSATETDANNASEYAQHGTYWLDSDSSWVQGVIPVDSTVTGPDASTWRDIYRYVTFVKDAAGNWSTDYTPTQGTNVDRSTNYWLGDFAPADAGGYNYSRGRVNTDDLQLLSVVYFGTVPGDYRDLMNSPFLPVENGNIGKSIPNPDQGSGTINFPDLVPFSFNYNMVSPVGTFATEFVVEPDPTVYRPFNRLDAMPVVNMSITEDPSLEIGSEFTVSVSLANNEGDVVKAVEAILTYCSALEVVSTSSASAVASEEGTLFAKAAAIEADNKVGFVAASCGGWTTLEGNATLGTVTFRVKSEITGTCEIELTSVQLFDNTGEIIEIEGETIPLSGASTLPTSYALYQNYPNPFNPTTNIQFDLKDAGHVKIMVFNTLGQAVATIADRELEAGRHTVSFDASNLASGLYLYSINVNGFSDLKKMVLIR